jgi:hypothetical protein
MNHHLHYKILFFLIPRSLIELPEDPVFSTRYYLCFFWMVVPDTNCSQKRGFSTGINNYFLEFLGDFEKYLKINVRIFNSEILTKKTKFFGFSTMVQNLLKFKKKIQKINFSWVFIPVLNPLF